MKKFYIDSCVWMNLFKREESADKKKSYWRIAEDFLKKCAAQEDGVYCSDVIIRELQIKLSKNAFDDAKELLSDCDRIEPTNEDIALARKIESELDFEISFYDILHILLAKNIGATLITRDKKMSEIAEIYCVEARHPEDFL